MGHDVLACPKCDTYIMEGHGDWECDKCGLVCNESTKWSWQKKDKKTSDEEVNEYFGGDTLAASVWVDKYALKDGEGNINETPDITQQRIANDMKHKHKATQHSAGSGNLYKVGDVVLVRMDLGTSRINHAYWIEGEVTKIGDVNIVVKYSNPDDGSITKSTVDLMRNQVIMKPSEDIHKKNRN